MKLPPRLASFLEARKHAVRRGWHWFRPVLRSRYFWGGLGALAVLLIVLYMVVNAWVMPTYTRYGVHVTVPSVENMTYAQAAALLEAEGLRPEREEQQYNPNVPPGHVLDQNPAPESTVKPGRRVYLKINSEDVPIVRVPDFKGINDRQARNRIRSLGLRVGTIETDTIPSPYPNTITRQEPRAGEDVDQGAVVNLWISPGLSAFQTDVPDVTDLSLEEARQVLLRAKLRPFVRPAEAEGEEDMYVERQEPRAGQRVQEGSEVRIYVARRFDGFRRF